MLVWAAMVQSVEWLSKELVRLPASIKHLSKTQVLVLFPSPHAPPPQIIFHIDTRGSFLQGKAVGREAVHKPL